MFIKKIILVVFISFLVFNVYGENSSKIDIENKRSVSIQKKDKIDHSRKIVYISGANEKFVGFLVNVANRIVIFTPMSTILKLKKIKVKTFDGQKLTVKSVYLHENRDLAIIPIAKKDCANLEFFSLADSKDFKANAKVMVINDSSNKIVKFHDVLLIGGSDDTLKLGGTQALLHGSPIINSSDKIVGMGINIELGKKVINTDFSNSTEKFNHNMRLDNIILKKFRKITRKNARELKLYRQLKEHNQIMMLHLNNFRKTPFIDGNFQYMTTLCYKELRFISTFIFKNNLKFEMASYNGNIAGENFVRRWNNWGKIKGDSNPASILLDLFNNMRVFKAKINKRKFCHKALMNQPHLLQRELKIQEEMKAILERIKLNIDKAYESYIEYYKHARNCERCD